MFRTTITLFVCLAGLPLQADDDAETAEQKQLQEDNAAIEGIWRRTFRDKSGRELTTTNTERGGITNSSGRVRSGSSNTPTAPSRTDPTPGRSIRGRGATSIAFPETACTRSTAS